MSETKIPKGYKRAEVGVIPGDWTVASIGNLSETSSGTTPSRSLYSRYFQNGLIHWVKTLDLNNSLIIDTDERVTEAALRETSLQVYPVGTVVVAMYGGYNQIGRTGLLTIPASVNQALTAIRPRMEVLDSGYLLGILNFKIDYWKSVASSSRKDPNITSQDVRQFPVSLPPVEEQRAIATALSDVDALLAGLDQLIAKKRDLEQAAMQQLLTGQKRLPGFQAKGELLNSEIGPIPEDWCTKKLFDVAKISTGLTPPTTDSANYGDEFLFVSPADLGKKKFINNAEKRLSKKGFLSARKFPRDSVLFVCIGSTIGKCGIASIELTSNQQINAIFPSPSFSSDFLFYCLNTFSSRIKSLGGELAVPLINKSQFSETLIPFPPLSEQCAISTVLSDMDAELIALEQRRDKTRALKQGMMQELLTGKIRLVKAP